jgi:hypothetical protein
MEPSDEQDRGQTVLGPNFHLFQGQIATERMEPVPFALSGGAIVTSAMEKVCRVCGFDDNDERWSSSGSPNYVICPCCAAESGVDDTTARMVRAYRGRWAKEGYPWFEKGQRPDPWSAEAQIASVPPEWR